MKELKITEGNFVVEEYSDDAVFSQEEREFNIQVETLGNCTIIAKFGNKADAELFNNASATYQECGMTPSELLANLEESQSSVSMLSATVKRLELENRELLAKHKEAIDAVNSIVKATNLDQYRQAIEKAHQAIKTVEK